MKFGDPRLPENFWTKIEIADSGCWDWIACKLPQGYGQFNMPKHLGGGKWLSHRLVALTDRGLDRSDLEVDHTCHNRACCNPEHLRLATIKQNRENISGAKRTSKTGIRGVSPSSQAGKWQAQVTHNRRHYHLGHFLTLEEAAAVVQAKRLELFTHNVADRAA